MLAWIALALATEGDRLLVAHASFPQGAEVTSVEVHVAVGEETRTLHLDDIGQAEHDGPHDDTWSGSAEVPYARWTEATLVVDGERVAQAFDRSDELGPVRVGWTLTERPDGWVAKRSIGTWPGAASPVAPERSTLVSLGWGALVLLYAGVVFALRRRG